MPGLRRKPTKKRVRPPDERLQGAGNRRRLFGLSRRNLMGTTWPHVCYACPWASRTIIPHHKGLEVISMTPSSGSGTIRAGFFARRSRPDPAAICLLEGLPSHRPRLPATGSPCLCSGTRDQPRGQQREQRDQPHAQHRVQPVGEEPRPRPLPRTARAEIDELNDRIYNSINNGVYRAGFATTQRRHEGGLHWTLRGARRDERPAQSRYDRRDHRADWRFFVTLVPL